VEAEGGGMGGGVGVTARGDECLFGGGEELAAACMAVAFSVAEIVEEAEVLDS